MSFAEIQDSQRFLVNVHWEEALDAPITVVVEWTEGLER